VRIVLDRAGKKSEAEVAADLSSVCVGGKEYPVVVVATGVNRVELEIDGEKAVVENWPDHFPAPFGPVDVNGERWTIKVESGPADVRVPTATSAARAATPNESAPAPEGEGVPVVPAMPGRVIEVRVKNGDRVTKGQTLLVLEAMKMRGEVASPADGVVHGLRVSSGANARAKEPMMWIRADAKS